MKMIDLAKKRYSVRSFSSRPVEPEKVALVLEAGRLAPTATNAQPQRILVLEGEQEMERLSACTKFTFGAPMALVVCADEEAAWVRSYDGKNHAEIDACIVATHMMLQAAELGLGTTWVGVFHPEKIAQQFGLPKNFVVTAVLPMGYPAEGALPSANHEKRKPLEETVTYHHF